MNGYFSKRRNSHLKRRGECDDKGARVFPTSLSFAVEKTLALVENLLLDDNVFLCSPENNALSPGCSVCGAMLYLVNGVCIGCNQRMSCIDALWDVLSCTDTPNILLQAAAARGLRVDLENFVSIYPKSEGADVGRRDFTY